MKREARINFYWLQLKAQMEIYAAQTVKDVGYFRIDALVVLFFRL